LPTGFIEQNQLAQQFYIEPTLQAAFPGQELGGLLNLLGQAQQILNIIGYLVLGIAGLTVFLAMYSAIMSRQHAIAVMRGLGGSRSTVFRVVIFETMILAVAGAIVGRILGYGIAALIASQIQQRAAIPISVRFMPELEVALWALAIGVGFLAGLIPALMAYRVNVVENLFPQ
jgi:putative ABC transport system permease protein